MPSPPIEAGVYAAPRASCWKIFRSIDPPWPIAKRLPSSLLAYTTPFASIAGLFPYNWAGAYSVVKAGLIMLTKLQAMEWAPYGIRANALLPGAIDTPITGAFRLPEGADASLLERAMPMGAFGSPEGVAAAIAYVASDEASHMNGADLVIDGGTLA